MSVTWHGEALVARLRGVVFRGVVRGTERVAERAVTLQMQSPRGGRQYGKHKASAPGEPPAPDTGRLVQSVHTRFEPTRLAGVVVASTVYAAGLEFGTERVEPRPFMRPALMSQRDEIDRLVALELLRELQAGKASGWAR